MKSVNALLVASMALVFAVTSAAFAGKQDFSLENQTGYQIEQVYVSSVHSDNWEEDVLGRRYLDDGERVNIHFQGGGGCMYDLKVVYSDGDTSEWEDFNLCKLSVIRLFYDRRTGDATAEYE
jgi:hypothetical protein